MVKVPVPVFLIFGSWNLIPLPSWSSFTRCWFLTPVSLSLCLLPSAFCWWCALPMLLFFTSHLHGLWPMHPAFCASFLCTILVVETPGTGGLIWDWVTQHFCSSLLLSFWCTRTALYKVEGLVALSPLCIVWRLESVFLIGLWCEVGLCLVILFGFFFSSLLFHFLPFL